MIPSLLCSLWLLAAPPAPGVKLAAPALTYVNLDDKSGEFFLDSLAQQLIKQGIQVTTPKEIGAVLGLERQKQLLGCSGEGGACVLELAGALGVDGIVTGSLAKIGAGLALNLKIVSAVDGRMLSAQGVRVKNEDALLDWLELGAPKIASEVRQALGRGATPTPTPTATVPTAAVPTPPPPAPPEPAAKVEQPPRPVAGAAAAPTAPGVPEKDEVEWNNRWYPARVLQRRPDGFALIHYEEYDASYDEWVAPVRLRKKAPAPPKIEVEWKGSWYPAALLERRASDGASYIHYQNYDDSWNEWVPPERLRIDGVRGAARH